MSLALSCVKPGRLKCDCRLGVILDGKLTIQHDLPPIPSVPGITGSDGCTRTMTVAATHQQSGDIHHIVPRDYLQEHGFEIVGTTNKSRNLLTGTSINISISKKPPEVYMAEVEAQIETGVLTLGGGGTDRGDLARNLAENAVPESVAHVRVATYPEFLLVRRHRMAATIRRYYEGL